MKNQYSCIGRPIHLACSTDDLRPILQCAVVHDGYLIATDAHVLVFLHLSETSFSDEMKQALEGKLIHRSVLQRIWNQMTLLKDGKLYVPAHKAHYDFTEFEEVKHGSFVADRNKQHPVINWMKTHKDTIPVAPTEKIRFNATFIDRLHKCLPDEYGTKQLSFWFPGSSGQATKVMRSGSFKSFAYLMPIMWSED